MDYYLFVLSLCVVFLFVSSSIRKDHKVTTASINASVSCKLLINRSTFSHYDLFRNCSLVDLNLIAKGFSKTRTQEKLLMISHDEVNYKIINQPFLQSPRRIRSVKRRSTVEKDDQIAPEYEGNETFPPVTLEVDVDAGLIDMGLFTEETESTRKETITFRTTAVTELTTTSKNETLGAKKVSLINTELVLIMIAVGFLVYFRVVTCMIYAQWTIKIRQIDAKSGEEEQQQTHT